MQKFAKPNAVKSFPVMTNEEKQAKVESYESIKLNFGKYKGQTLKEIQLNNPDYLVWLSKQYTIDEKTSPTMKAILKYCKKNLN